MEAQVGLRDSLISAALTILETEGEEPSLRAVARAVGVSAMAPYNHFPDKAGLMAAVANQGFKALAETLLLADDNPDPYAALAAQGMAFVDFAQAKPALFRLMYSRRYGDADMQAVRTTYRILADRVAGICPASASAATLACRSLVQGMAAIALEERLAPSVQGDIAAAIRLFIEGLRSGTKRPRRRRSRQEASGR